MPTHEGLQLDADEPLKFYLGAVVDSDALAGDVGCLRAFHLSLLIINNYYYLALIFNELWIWS